MAPVLHHKYRAGAYLTASEETTLVPDVFGPNKRRWASSRLGAGTVVRMAEQQRPSPVTEDLSEPYVQWEDCIGRRNYGWLPANVALTERRGATALRYQPCDPSARISTWARLRAQLFDGGPGRVTMRRWIDAARTKKEAAVLTLIVREFGGRVTEHDDVRTLATRTRRMVIPNVGRSQESVMHLSTQKSSKGTPIILPSSSKKTASGNKSKKTSAKKVSSPKKSKKTQHAGRVSKFAGCTFKKLVKENPRNAGSVGHKMWDKLRTGMTYEQYIANGGGRSHLAWDIKHGYVKVIRGAK